MASLKTLEPWLIDAAQWIFDLGHDYDARLRVTSTRRSFQDQARLYADYKAGRSQLPAAPPGRSMHQLGRAFDLARMGIDPYVDDLLPELGALWIGLGGFWSSTDPVHFQA